MTKMLNRARRALAALAGAGLAMTASGAHAADQRYVVMSMIGDAIHIVWRQPSSGSNLDKNEHHDVAMNDAALDKVALLAVDDALRRAGPKSNATLMVARDPAALAAQTKMLSQGDDQSELLSTVQALLPSSAATRLILIAQNRGDARLPMVHGHVGEGKLSGLGFYLDRYSVVRDADSGHADQGFIAPYAYLELSLVELPSMKVIQRSVVREATTAAVAGARDVSNPWDAMTNKQKLDALSALIRRDVNRAMRELLAAE